MADAALSYAPGDMIRVIDGPFSNFAGIVREVDQARGELLVEVTMFGRPIPIHTEPWQVARS